LGNLAVTYFKLADGMHRVRHRAHTNRYASDDMPSPANYPEYHLTRPSEYEDALPVQRELDTNGPGMDTEKAYRATPHGQPVVLPHNAA
jgi:hypothetical protein